MLRIVAILIVLSVFVQSQSVPQLPGDCYQYGLEDCVGTNPAPGQPMNSTSAIHCLWCHSHHNGTDAQSHCAPLQHIQTNSDYQTGGWMCDYRMPHAGYRSHVLLGIHGHEGKSAGKHMVHGKHGGKHGRHLLDISTREWATQQVADWPPLAQFVAGFVWGVSGQIPNDLLSCLADSALTIEDVNTTFQQWTWPSDVAEVATDLHLLLTDVLQAVQAGAACISVGLDVTDMVLSVVSKVMTIINDISDGNVLGIVWWGVELGIKGLNIFPDVAASLEAAQTNDWFSAGVPIGNFVYVLAF